MKLLPYIVLSLCVFCSAPDAGAANAGRVFTNKVAVTPSVVYLRGFHGKSQKGPTCNV